MTDQIGNRGEPSEVARANRVYAELYKLRPIPGVDADFTSDHYKDSSAPGWCEDDAVPGSVVPCASRSPGCASTSRRNAVKISTDLPHGRAYVRDRPKIGHSDLR